MEYRGETFENREVEVDGNTYNGCTFRDCTLVYSGGQLPQIEGSNLFNPRFRFRGAAERTIQVLMGFYHGLGDTGRQLVDEVFANIRRGGPRGSST